MSTYARTPYDRTGTRVSRISAATAPAARPNHSEPSRYTTQPHADSARKPSATVTSSIVPGPSGASSTPSTSTSGCGVGAIGIPY